MFRDKLKSELDSLKPSESTKLAILEKLNQPVQQKSKILTFKITSMVAACLAVVVALGVFLNIYSPIDNIVGENYDMNYSQTTQQHFSAKTQKTDKKKNKNKTKQTTTVKKKVIKDNAVYDKIYNLVNEKYKLEEKDKELKGNLVFETMNSEDSSYETPSISGTKNFSKTNTQHKNVDEEDIIKTDGDYIYRLKEKYEQDEIVIYKADGKKTKKVSTIDVYPLLDDYYLDDEYYSESNASGMYLYGNKLVVVYESYTKIFAKDCKCKYCEKENYENFTQILIFDITKKSKPKFIKEFKQSGYYDNSRIIDGKLYVSSNYCVSTYEKIKKKEKTRYLPMLCEGKTQKIQSEDKIYFADDTSSIEYVVICSYDIDKTSRVDDMSIFGQSEMAYVSENNIYLTEEVYNDDYDVFKTKVTRLSLNKGFIKRSAKGQFSGEILNQFSMDEYKGYLRLVATQDSWREDSYNSLCILDSNMNVVSSIKKLAKGECIYSARFMGDYAYFVTFKETDPLFCADVSNPRYPRIVSKLKIPGFSDYLHPFGKNKLFGFGQSTTKNGEVTGLKLSMFDISDKTNIKEENVLKLGDGYSEANYNHKAILVSSDKNLIAFSMKKIYTKNNKRKASSYYYIYSYGKNSFKQLARIKVFDMSANSYYDYEGGEVRGLYIDDYFYISDGEQLIVVDLNTFKVVKD